MKTIILAGGLGTRFSEETDSKPKPMILIDHRPILWHIMDIYATQGFNDFIIATGYRSEVIDDWVRTLNDDWSVRTLFTGLHTQTGGRIKKCLNEIEDDIFFATYGDGLGNIKLKNLLDFHTLNNSVVTATAVRPPARFGYMEIGDGCVMKFGEKNQVNEGWINGGFFVMTREVIKHISSDDEPLETGALSRLTDQRKFYAYQHHDFWLPMDTRSEQMTLSKLSQQNPPPWKLG